MKFITRYICNILIAVDQLVNAVFWGDPDETISSRMGVTKKDNCPPNVIFIFWGVVIGATIVFTIFG